MPLPVRDCQRLVEVAGYRVHQKSGQMNSRFFLDRYVNTRRTRADKLETRRYMKDDVKPLFYSGQCEPPQKLKSRAQALTVQEFSFPSLKAEVQIACGDVDDHSVTPEGRLLMPGRERYDAAVNYEMMHLMDSWELTRMGEAISIIKNGGYTIRKGPAPADVIGTVDFKRENECWNLVESDGLYGPWDDMCAKPFKSIEKIMQDVGRCGVSGELDILYSPLAWDFMELHDEREAIKYDNSPLLANEFQRRFAQEYAAVTFKGSTHGGILNHFVINTQYPVFDEATGECIMEPVLAPGEVLLVWRSALGLQQVFNIVSADGAEELPDNMNIFLYDDPTHPEVYSAKKEVFSPWMKERHLMIPQNVDGAQLLKVVSPDAEPCVACEKCPDPTDDQARLAAESKDAAMLEALAANTEAVKALAGAKQ